jgi:IMP cyclohydrolase
MYVGRIVAVGQARSNKLVAMYRLSSRSYPNREFRQNGQTVAVAAKPGFESKLQENPYISYTCLRASETHAVAGNGTHVDPIADQLEVGSDVIAILKSVLHEMGYERDSNRTPRIAGVVDRISRVATFGIVRHDGLIVRNVDLKNGEAFYMATYEHDSPDARFHEDHFNPETVEDACKHILIAGAFRAFDHPIASACAYESDSGFQVVRSLWTSSGEVRSVTLTEFIAKLTVGHEPRDLRGVVSIVSTEFGQRHRNSTIRPAGSSEIPS